MKAGKTERMIAEALRPLQSKIDKQCHQNNLLERKASKIQKKQSLL